MRIEIPAFEEKEDLFDWLIENKSINIAAKKAEFKEADSIQVVLERSSTNKADTIDVNTVDRMDVKSIINTTMVMDSHDDVHINGLWRKSLRINKDLFLLQEHKMAFDKIISDNVKASAQLMTWKELGFNFKGETEALVFDSDVEKDRNEYMFTQYAKGRVKNHSVGMRYIKLALALNSEENSRKAEKKIWDTHIENIVNSKEVSDQGFFWAVTEARVIEGSAVVKGSNPLTPTTSMQAKEEQSDDTPNKHEQSSNTRKTNNYFLINK